MNNQESVTIVEIGLIIKGISVQLKENNVKPVENGTTSQKYVTRQKKSVYTVCEKESENSTESEELFIDSIKHKGLNSTNTKVFADLQVGPNQVLSWIQALLPTSFLCTSLTP